MILLLMACAAGGGERVSAPPEAVVHVDLPTFAALTPADLPTLERHLRSSQRWEIRLESAAAHEHRLAMRRQAVTDDQGRVQYPSGSNGFYSNFQAQDIYQTRVLLGLNGEYGLGNARVGVTRASARAGAVQLELVQSDQPGLWSELIVAGGAGLTLEIYEQSRTGARPATTAALSEVESELAAVLAGRAELDAKGWLEGVAPPGSVVVGGAPSLSVKDGAQPGMFRFLAQVNPGEPGTAYIKASYVGAAKDGPSRIPPELIGHEDEELSAGRLREASAREIGWSTDPGALFLYEAGGTVYEGDWDNLYRARFGLWFHPEHGPDRELLTVDRDIAGWQR